MSQWKFNDFETEIDFTDADFLEKFENCYQKLLEDSKTVPKVGKTSAIIRYQCEILDAFFDSVFGIGASKKMFGEKKSLDLRMQAADLLYETNNKERNRYNTITNKYRPNRKQRRSRR